MTTKYICDVCGKEFGSSWVCRSHEAQHFSGVERIKYELDWKQEELCDYCANSYYVYGCEQDCKFNDCNYDNNHKDFIPVKPIHNKRECGGV